MWVVEIDIFEISISGKRYKCFNRMKSSKIEPLVIKSVEGRKIPTLRSLNVRNIFSTF